LNLQVAKTIKSRLCEKQDALDHSNISKTFLMDIKDDSTRNLIIELLNIIEEQNQIISELKETIQKQRDEINHLKGEQGKPKFSSYKKQNRPSLSSEKERKKPKDWSKEGKKDNIKTDKEIRCELSKEELGKLPGDTRLLRYETRIEQNLKIVRENIKYYVAVYYSVSENKTYYAPLPSDYQGIFGISLKSFIHVMTHVLDVTQSKLLYFLKSAGIEISSGSLNNILLEQSIMYELERKAILQAGLTVGAYAGMDSTCTKQNGQQLYTQIINNELFTVFSSRSHKSRLSVLSVLQDTEESQLFMSLNADSIELLDVFCLSRQDKNSLHQIFEEGKIYTKAQVEQIITEQLPALRAKENMFHRLLEALAIGYYHNQTTYPKVERLITDDAGEYKKIANSIHFLCWVHDARHYKKLTPFIEVHRQIFEEFKKKYWEFYNKLLGYGENPNENKAAELEKEFDCLFTSRTDYFQLNQRIEKTFANKKQLLAVLKFPFVPLHNNASELAARRVVTKRKISLHTINDLGTTTKDAAMSIVETAKKLKVNVIEYLSDRISGKNQMTALADLIYTNSS
jgi:hypothetical protein